MLSLMGKNPTAGILKQSKQVKDIRINDTNQKVIHFPEEHYTCW